MKTAALAVIALVIAGCGPALPDCDPDEDLRWKACPSGEPDTCGEWVCVAKSGEPS